VPTRLLALLGAVAMVAGAFVVRAKLDQHEEDKAHRPHLVCITELADACRILADQDEIDVTVEPAGQTVDRVLAQGGAGDIDGWLTAAPFPQIVTQRRQALGLVRMFTNATPPILASSRVTLAVWPDRANALRQQPGCPIGWKCLGQVAAKKVWSNVPNGQATWGPVKIALPDPENGAVGLTAFGAAAVDYFGRADLSAADLDDDGFRDWVSALKATTPAVGRQPNFNELLATGPSLEDAFVATEAEAAPALAASRRTVKPELIYPAPVTTVDLVLATAPGRPGDRLREAVGRLVREELLTHGWQRPTPPGSSPLLDPGVLQALRRVWKEAA
jgi:hypothetical protein